MPIDQPAYVELLAVGAILPTPWDELPPVAVEPIVPASEETPPVASAKARRDRGQASDDGSGEAAG